MMMFFVFGKKEKYYNPLGRPGRGETARRHFIIRARARCACDADTADIILYNIASRGCSCRNTVVTGRRALGGADGHDDDDDT